MFPEVDKKSWILVCEGELGDMSHWEPGFEVFDEVKSVLCGLEDVEDEIDWPELIGNHSYFSGLSNADFPPLYRESEFGIWFDDFLFIADDDEEADGDDEDEEADDDNEEADDDRPGMSFQRFRLYLDSDNKVEIVDKFKIFLAHLVSLPIVRRVNARDELLCLTGKISTAKVKFDDVTGVYDSNRAP